MITSVPRWLAAMLALDALLAWALAVLLGPAALPTVLVGGLAGTAVAWWQQWRRPADRERRVVVGRALREHRDPGARWRAEVTDTARVRLGRRASDGWLPGVLCVALAVACVVAAVLRADWTDVLPAVPLVGLGALSVRVAGTALRDAARWLDSPPSPVDAGRAAR
jgi:hypothetical protein